jgi:hypothetical protein
MTFTREQEKNSSTPKSSKKPSWDCNRSACFQQRPGESHPVIKNSTFTYKSLVEAIFENRGLRLERKPNVRDEPPANSKRNAAVERSAPSHG